MDGAGSTPQFRQAEYIGTPEGDRCTFCGQTIAGTYYRVNQKMACPACADQKRREVPASTAGAYSRALIFGMGAALVGLAIYAVFGILTGLEIGYLALAVGWLVARAMMKGSRGIGGRKYQITAVVLTYAAISMAAIPIGISQYVKQQRQNQVRSASSQEPVGSTSASSEEEARPSAITALGKLAFLGLVSPFLELEDGISGILGLVILLVGIQIAWKLTRGAAIMDIAGPYSESARAAAP